MDRGVLVEGMYKSFGAFRALDGLDLVVPAGTVGAVLGPNGAGKTTTIRILTTLDTADSGKAIVGGYNVASAPHSVRSVIALTGQYAAVDGDLSGRQNLVMIGRLYRLGRVAAKQRADQLLERFSLTAAANRLVRTYSGGMRRRLDLAASLVLSPEVLFLDEPTTGLDPPSREELWTVVRSLKDAGTTIVLTTQYLEEADRLADNVTVIDRGRAVAQGTPAELKADLGGDVLELSAYQANTVARAVAELTERVGAKVESLAPRQIQDLMTQAVVRVPAGSLSVVDAVRLLDSSGLRLEDIQLRRASLDEVFAALTSHA
ncbi:ATP-binding cassette domain-containing protein [Jatrophihabitans sp. DSM 45814]